MAELDAAASGRFKIGGDMEVNRLGFGAMRVTGPGIWGEPADPEEARRVLRRLPELGIDFIDTADSYGPEVSERLICEVLHPYKDMVIATKAGLIRPARDDWSINGDPAYLRSAAEASLKRLKVERIDLWQLHRIDPKRPRQPQFEAIARMQADGLVRHVGLSEVTVAEIEAASRYFSVATVQNRYNLVDRGSEEVLDYCEANAIGFIPWYPLAAGRLNQSGSVLDTVARSHEATPGQIALAWALKRSPVMLPIPGTGKLRHMEENVAAASITLTDEEFAILDAKGREAWAQR
jgi:aryl-alcohol dehydrogenase-like predicted oxidoreductase